MILVLYLMRVPNVPAYAAWNRIEPQWGNTCAEELEKNPLIRAVVLHMDTIVQETRNQANRMWANLPALTNPLTRCELFALLAYTYDLSLALGPGDSGRNFYYQLNMALRDGRPGSDVVHRQAMMNTFGGYMKWLMAALDKLPNVACNPCYRATGFPTAAQAPIDC